MRPKEERQPPHRYKVQRATRAEVALLNLCLWESPTCLARWALRGASRWCIEAGRPERWAASLGLPSRGSGWLARTDQVLLARLADGDAEVRYDTPRTRTLGT